MLDISKLKDIPPLVQIGVNTYLVSRNPKGQLEFWDTWEGKTVKDPRVVELLRRESKC